MSILFDILEPLVVISRTMPQKTPEARAAYQKQYREKHADELRAKNAIWRAANVESLKIAKHQDYLLNRETYKSRAKANRLLHLDEIKARRSRPEYRLHRNQLRRVAYALAHPPQPKPTAKSREQMLQDKRDDWANKPYWEKKLVGGIGVARVNGARIIGIDSLRALYKQVFEKPEGTCSYCLKRLPIRSITLDHKQPYKLGGTHEISNLAVSCITCNLKKGIKPLSKWLNDL